MKHVSPASECIKCICIVNVHLKGTVYKCTLDLTHGQHKSYAIWFNPQRSLWAFTYLHRISKDYNRTFRHTGKSFFSLLTIMSRYYPNKFNKFDNGCPGFLEIQFCSLSFLISAVKKEFKHWWFFPQQLKDYGYFNTIYVFLGAGECRNSFLTIT